MERETRRRGPNLSLSKPPPRFRHTLPIFSLIRYIIQKWDQISWTVLELLSLSHERVKRMSSGDQPTSAFISPKEYEENQAKIAAAQKYLESLTSKNEIGLRRFQELEAQKRELQRKIEEGEQAKCVRLRDFITAQSCQPLHHRRAMEQLRNL